MAISSPARMPSPEGRGNAQSRWRKAWQAYERTTVRLAQPVVQPLADRITGVLTADLAGFWLLWHLEGGFEGLQRLGMSRSGIYRRVQMFRKVTGMHPDEFALPGVSIDVHAYLTGTLAAGQMTFGPRDTHPSRDTGA